MTEVEQPYSILKIPFVVFIQLFFFLFCLCIDRLLAYEIILKVIQPLLNIDKCFPVDRGKIKRTEKIADQFGYETQTLLSFLPRCFWHYALFAKFIGQHSQFFILSSLGRVSSAVATEVTAKLIFPSLSFTLFLFPSQGTSLTKAPLKTGTSTTISASKLGTRG